LLKDLTSALTILLKDLTCPGGMARAKLGETNLKIKKWVIKSPNQLSM